MAHDRISMVVVSSAPLILKDGKFFAYAPYVAEMALWAKHVNQMDFVCPVLKDDDGALLAEVPFAPGRIYKSKAFNLKTAADLLKAVFYAPLNFFQLYRGMRRAGHIHLRCPGNLPLMGCLVQTLFPRKCKSAKYAGNWDPKAVQPLSYRFQKWWLAHTLLSRRMKVMAYGNWPGSSTNVLPFFTATYRESDKIPVTPRRFDQRIRMVFVGTLSSGKQPIYAIQLAEALKNDNHDIRLELYGNGSEKASLEKYVTDNNLSEIVDFKGNRPASDVAQAYRDSHFVILPSRSEGWPKAVAEGMFWGCLPLATPVSCVPYMLDEGGRGVLLTCDVDQDRKHISALIENEPRYREKVTSAMAWSRQFTVDLFEIEIRKLLTACA